MDTLVQYVFLPPMLLNLECVTRPSGKCCTLQLMLLPFALTVHFRYVVFRPFMDEIVAGKIRSSSKEGVHGGYRALCRIKLLPVTHVLVDMWMLTVKPVHKL